jgi:tRNA-dihydrouridine synthase 2
LDRRF